MVNHGYYSMVERLLIADHRPLLVALDARVDVLDEDQAELECRRTQHEEEGERDHCHVSKVERRL